MAVFNTYKIKGSSADGELISGIMSQSYEQGYASVIFYTDDTYETPVTPSAGTVVLTMSESGVQYGTVTNGDIDPTLTSYARPNWAGAITFGKATFSGITGAPFVIVSIHRYGRQIYG